MGEDILFCCCDDDISCNSDINNSTLDGCESVCDTLVAVLPPDCVAGEECEISTCSVTNITSVSPYGFIFSFGLNGVPTEVHI